MVSIIIPCRNEHFYIRQTLQHILAMPAKIPYEVIVVDDGSVDGCCDFLRDSTFSSRRRDQEIKLLTTPGMGVTRARNSGAYKAIAPHMVFCDAHIIPSPGWLEELTGSLEEVDAVCSAITFTKPPHYTFYGGTWNQNLSWFGIAHRPPGLQEIPFAPSGCLAIRKEVFKNVGGFEKDFQIWGYDDAELSLKLWLFGYRIGVNPFVRILHINRAPPGYQKGGHLVHNLLLLAMLHFSEDRLARVIDLARHYPGFTPELWRGLWDKHYVRRLAYLQNRVFSDDWFMGKFGIPF